MNRARLFNWLGNYSFLHPFHCGVNSDKCKGAATNETESCRWKEVPRPKYSEKKPVLIHHDPSFFPSLGFSSIETRCSWSITEWNSRETWIRNSLEEQEEE